MRVFLTIISLSLLLTSCGLFNSSNSSEVVELTEAIEKWNSTKSLNYTFLNSRICECMPPYEYTVVVEKGEIIDVRFKMEEYLSYDTKQLIIQSTKTIDELFDILEQYEKTADYYDVTFHEELGYPTKINIDPFKEMADEEIILEISNYTAKFN